MADYMRTKYWSREVDGEMMRFSHEDAERLSKLVFTKPQYDEQVRDVMRVFPNHALFGTRCSRILGDDYRGELEALHVLWIARHIHSIGLGDRAAFIADAVENGTTKLNPEQYRGVTSLEVANVGERGVNDGAFACRFTARVHYAYSQWLALALERYKSAIHRHGYFGYEASCSLEYENGEPVTYVDNLLGDGCPLDKLATLSVTVTYYEALCDEEAIENAVLLAADTLAEIHLAGVKECVTRTVDKRGGSTKTVLARMFDTPLTQLWFACYDESKDKHVGNCRVCGNPFIADTSRRMMCDKCSNWVRRSKGERTVY